MADLKSWRLELESLIPDRKNQIDPPGYDFAIARDPIGMISTNKPRDRNTLARKQQALYAKATAPLKQVGMMCFMAWMMGNGIQIFSIFMTFNLLSSPLSAIMSSGEVFPRDEEWKQLDTLTPRALYCLVHAGQLIFGLYKLSSMRLLPSTSSDFISTMPVPAALEAAYTAL
ncbi:hypothetical protein HYH03_005542 [Edaphochlamys debaryana]|uniref:ER membrane protein complex subunit 4 n=1 Tax=Edaphochlamys debaryana TaxID=47281 RepID=A0A835YEU3_9CHLO|nr:hypothetical protein HYH03_005542 [Edaphochlamys debaryana]|eukprot:KAG2496309.1 hypothetical protein HYH03_005542 [Edaphochlamys debaryana]